MCYFAPLSPPRLSTLWNQFSHHTGALGLPLCTCHFQTDRAKILAEIGEKPKTKFFIFLKFHLKGWSLCHIKALRLKLCTWHFRVDRAKNLAEIGEKPPKACNIVPLSHPRLFTRRDRFLYHIRALSLPLCTCHFQTDRAKILAEIGEKPRALSLPLCTCHFQADRAKNLAEIGEKPKTKFLILIISSDGLISMVGDCNPLGVTCLCKFAACDNKIIRFFCYKINVCFSVTSTKYI